MADVFGRNSSLNASILIMLVGSALCTGPPTSAFPMLLVGRGLQGVAAAGLNVLVRTILADRVSLRENSKNMSIFSLVGGISYGVGPVIGGYLTKASWRWCFAINLPICVVSLVIVFFIVRKELLGPQPIAELDETAETGRRTKFTARLKTIDYGGQILFIIGFGLIILGLTWGGASYPWKSAAVIASLVLGVIFAVCFIVWEYMLAPGNPLSLVLPYQKPMLPWVMLCNRDVLLLSACEFASGMTMFAVLYYCNIYFMAVLGYDSGESGKQLLYFLPGLAAGVYLNSFMRSSILGMTFPCIFGALLFQIVGLSVLAYGMDQKNKPLIFGMLAVTGFGLGLRLTTVTLHGVAQFRQNRATVIGLLALMVPLGGTIGLTIMSTVFNNASGLGDVNLTEEATTSSAQSTQLRAEQIDDAKVCSLCSLPIDFFPNP